MRRTPMATDWPSVTGNARCSCCVRVTSSNRQSPARFQLDDELRVRTPFVESHAHALERAGENHLLDCAVRDEVRAQVVARRRELDFFGTQHGDHFVLAAAFELFDCARIDGRCAEANALRRLSREQQIRRAQERRNEARRRRRIQLIRLTALPASGPDS